MKGTLLTLREQYHGTVEAESTYCSGLQSLAPGPEIAAASGNVLEMQILRLHIRPSESKTLDLRVYQSVF